MFVNSTVHNLCLPESFKSTKNSLDGSNYYPTDVQLKNYTIEALSDNTNNYVPPPMEIRGRPGEKVHAINSTTVKSGFSSEVEKNLTDVATRNHDENKPSPTKTIYLDGFQTTPEIMDMRTKLALTSILMLIAGGTFFFLGPFRMWRKKISLIPETVLINDKSNISSVSDITPLAAIMSDLTMTSIA